MISCTRLNKHPLLDNVNIYIWTHIPGFAVAKDLQSQLSILSVVGSIIKMLKRVKSWKNIQPQSQSLPMG